MKLTERDKKLLLALAYFVIIVGFGAFVFRPLISHYMNLGDQVALLSAQKEEMDAQIDEARGLERKKREMTDLFRISTQDLYPMLESQGVDKEVTGIVLSCGMQALNLSIVMPEEPVSLVPYLYAEEMEAAQVPVSEELPEENAEEADEAQAGETSDAEEEDLGYIYAPIVTLTASGTEAQVENLIDTLTGDYPAIRLRSYSRQVQDAQWGEEAAIGTEVLSLELELYMCDRNLEGQGENG